MNDINIFLVRHGESTANIIPDMIGQAADTELTENGKEQAKKLGQRLGKIITMPDFVASSSFRRAFHTANIVAEAAEWTNIDEQVNINITDTLVEYNPGDWRGKHRSEVYKDINIINKAGGERFQIDMFLDRNISPEFSKMLCEKGVVFGKTNIVARKMEASMCHINSFQYAMKRGGAVWSGFALSNDGCWRVHSWVVKKGKVIECTPIRREMYFGLVIDSKEMYEAAFIVKRT